MLYFCGAQVNVVSGAVPDLITHISAAHLLRRGYEARYGYFTSKYMVLFYLGSILPDLIARPATILFPQTWILWLTMPAHSPIGCLIISYIIVLLCKENFRNICFKFLAFGCIIHFALDIMQKHVLNGSYYLLFPLSWFVFNIPLFWPSDSVIAVIPLLLLILCIELVRLMKNDIDVKGEQS